MSDNRSAFLAGAKAVSPILLGVIPFGLICGAVGVGAGLDEWAASSLSWIIFAGASQLAAIQLMAQDASVPVVILTGLVINARFLMYSASIASHFDGLPPLRKASVAYLLTDQAYAVSIARFTEDDTVPRFAYYLGTALLMWVSFNLTTVAGAYLGAFIPASWQLDFAIPLTFIALVIPAVKDRPTVLAAAVAGTVAFLAAPLPYNLGLMTAAATGILAGYLAERRDSHD